LSPPACFGSIEPHEAIRGAYLKTGRLCRQKNFAAL
jgi:hypothetical protein